METIVDPIEVVEPEESEPLPQPEETEAVDCLEPLTLSPEFPVVNILNNVDFQYSGGSGEYRFRIEEPANDAQIHPSTGRLIAGNIEGSLTVTLLDDLCEAETTSEVEVIGSFRAKPAAGRISTGTQFEITAENVIGQVECSLILDDSGATLNGCDYTAGTAVGNDIIRVEDSITGTAISIDLEVDIDVAFDLNGELWLIPQGSTMWPDAEGGTNEFNLTLVSGTAVQIDGDIVTGIEQGVSEIRVEDSFTGDQATVKAIVAAPITRSAERDGGSGSRDPSSDMLGGVDWNGDGIEDILFSSAGADYSSDKSGAVFMYAGTSNGFDPTPVWKWPEDVISDYRIGDSMASGDINGDGVPDLVVGAMYGLVGNNWNGFADVFISVCSDLSSGNEDCGNGLDDDGDGDIDCADSDCGNPILPATPTQRLSSQGEREYGSSIALCDLNGDGYDDVIIGAPYTYTTTSLQRLFTGAMVIMTGGPDGVDELNRFLRRGKIWNPYTNDWGYGVPVEGSAHPNDDYVRTLFGEALACEDVNNDGFADVVVSSPNTLNGVASLYLGDASAVLGESPVLQIEVSELQGTVGYLGSWFEFGHLSNGGPLLLGIGVPNTNETANRSGSILFFDAATLDTLGPTTSDSSALLQLNGTQNSDFLGARNGVSWGEYNGEPGLLVGLGNDPWASIGGSLYWINGSDIVDNGDIGSLGTLISSGTGDDTIGWNTAISNDGFASFALHRSDYGEDVGAPLAFDLLGNESVLGFPGAPTLNGFSSSALFFDIDGNGVDDILLGAPGSPVSGIGADVGEIWYCADGDPTDCNNQFTFSLPVDQAGSMIGGALERGDFDGDGIDELIVLASGMERPSDYSAYGSSATCSGDHWDGNHGAALIFKTDDLTQPAAIIFGDFPMSKPTGLVSGFDFNGDGFEDILFGGPGDYIFYETTGGINLVYGQALTVGSAEIICPDEVLSGPEMGDRAVLANSMAFVGDIDTDGCDEIAVGSTYDISNSGAFYLLWGGGSACGNLPEISLVTGDSGSALGADLSGGMDFDSDGIPDILVSEPSAYQYFSDQGKIWGLSGAEFLTIDRIPIAWGGLVPLSDEISPATLQDFSPMGLWVGDSVNAQIGSSVGFVADWMGLGRSNFFIKEPFGSGNSDGSGGGFMARFTNGGLESAKSAVLAGETGTSGFGNLLRYGEVDGQPILVIGAPYSDAENPDEGAVYVFPLEGQ